VLVNERDWIPGWRQARTSMLAMFNLPRSKLTPNDRAIKNPVPNRSTVHD
jgi:hypothetical protein